MGGVYSTNAPGFRVGKKDREKLFYPDIDGNFTSGIPGEEGDSVYRRPEGYWNGGSDWSAEQVPDASQNYLVNDPTGKSTSDLIAVDGTVKTFLPPDSRSFILGPLVDGYVPNHGSDNYTNIGYIQKDTRQFVLLARIQGQFTTDLHSPGARVWDGTSEQLTIYNENFTLAMAEWFRDQITAGKSTTNVPYFYSGGVPQEELNVLQCPNCPPNMFGGVTPGTGGAFGQGTPPSLGTQQDPPQSGNQVKINYFNLSPDQVRTLAALLAVGLSIAAIIAVLFPEPGTTAAGATYLTKKFAYAAAFRRTLRNLFKPKPRPYKKLEYPRPQPPKPKDIRFDPKKPGGGKEWQDAARNWQRQNPGKYNPYRSDSANQMMKQQGVGTQPNPNSAFRKPLSNSYSHITDVQQKLILETFNKALLNETAPTGSGPAGGTEVADAYVDGMEKQSTPEQLDQASKDANDIAKEGGQGVSDAELENINKTAREDARKIEYYVRNGNPEGMNDNQLFKAADLLYQQDEEKFMELSDLYIDLIDREASDRAVKEYQKRIDYIYSEDYYRTFGNYGTYKDKADALWPTISQSSGYTEKNVLQPEGYYHHKVYKNGVQLSPEASRAWSRRRSEWYKNYTAHYDIFYNEINPEQSKQKNLAFEKYAAISDRAYRPHFIAIIKAWHGQENFDDDPYSLDDITPGEIANMSEAEKKKLRKTLMKLGISYGDIAYGGVDALDLTSEVIAAVAGLGIAGLMGLYNVTKNAATNFVNAVTSGDESLDLDSYDNPYTRERGEREGEKMADLEGEIERKEAGQSQAEKQEKAEAEQKRKDAEKEVREAEASGNEDRIDRAYKNYKNAVKNKQRVNNKWKNQKKLPGYKGESYKPRFRRNRKPLTETRTPKQRRILREIKQPVKVKEAPTKYKMNFSGKYSAQNTPDKTASHKTDELVSSANAKGQRWRESDKYWSGYETTEKMNIIHDKIGHGSQYWDRMLDEAKNKNGWRTREVQEELNKIAHERAMLKENPDYKSPFGNVEISTTEKNIQNFERVNKIKKMVSDTKAFNNKEIKPEYPDDGEQKEKERMLQQYQNNTKKEYEHPKAQSGENAAARYKRLDPISAKSMPDAGYPQIDDLRDMARKKPK